METLTVADISVWSTVLPFAVGIAAFQRLDARLKMFVGFLLLGVLTEIAAWFYGKRYNVNMPVYNMYLLLELPCWITVLMHGYRPRRIQNFFAALSVMFVVGYLACLLHFGFNEIFNVPAVLKGLVITAAAGLVLLQLSTETETPMWYQPMFWIAGGALVYFAITTVLFSLLSTILLSTDDIVSDTWAFHSTVNILVNVLYTVGLTCSFLKVNSLSPSRL